MTSTNKTKVETLVYSIVAGIVVAVVMLIVQGFSGDKIRISELEKCKLDRTEFKAEIEKKADKEVVTKMAEQIQFIYENEIKKARNK